MEGLPNLASTTRGTSTQIRDAATVPDRPPDA